MPPKQPIAKPKTTAPQPVRDPKTSTPTPTKAPPERSMNDKQELLEVLRLQRDVQRATLERVQAEERVILLQRDIDKQKPHEFTNSGAKSSSWGSWNSRGWRPRQGYEFWYSWKNEGLQ